MHKERWLVPAVTLQEAMALCLQENTSVFCIENPLYSSLDLNMLKEKLPEYRMEGYAEKEIVILTKIKGKNTFDAHKYEPYYLPLHWENWHS